MTLTILAIALFGAVELPVGSAPDALDAGHFPDRLHAYVWRNWQLVPAERLAEVVGAEREQIVEMGLRMGLCQPPAISEEQWRRSYITIIRRNWHLLPYEQLLELLDWTPEQMAYTLREDDFLFVKLGNLKPKCERLVYKEPDAAARLREDAIDAIVLGKFGPGGVGEMVNRLFGFVKDLSKMPTEELKPVESRFSPRYCYSYFALYGDALADEKLDSYPEGYLARLSASGVNGVWLQGVLFKLSPFPWDESLSEGYETRLANLRKLVARAKKHRIGIYVYLNEPRSMPLAFFESHPELKGVEEGDWASMCTSAEPVKRYIREGVARIVREVPDLAGFFTITASENLTNCWSHHQGAKCPRCKDRGPAEVIAEVNGLIREGIAAGGGKQQLIAWDWGWKDEWAADAIRLLPEDAALNSVSEWSIPIERGGVKSVVGEYSISTIGPGPRASRHWQIARERGLKTLAKVQANNTWELSPVPYIPALENVARHAANLREAGVDGVMLSWTLGGYPSPNLEVFAEMGRADEPSVDTALMRVATRRFGEAAADVVKAWKLFSVAFREYPYHIGGMYSGPQQMGPANLLWEKPTGYRASMVGFPYDDLDAWRSVFPAEVYARQFKKMADGFDAAIEELYHRYFVRGDVIPLEKWQWAALQSELSVARACAIHFRSVANQAEFVMARDALAKKAGNRGELLAKLENILLDEIRLATELYNIQRVDSRIGFEASNHYFYVPLDLAEKVLNCRDLLDRWLPALRAEQGV